MKGAPYRPGSRGPHRDVEQRSSLRGAREPPFPAVPMLCECLVLMTVVERSDRPDVVRSRGIDGVQRAVVHLDASSLPSNMRMGRPDDGPHTAVPVLGEAAVGALAPIGTDGPGVVRPDRDDTLEGVLARSGLVRAWDHAPLSAVPVLYQRLLDSRRVIAVPHSPYVVGRERRDSVKLIAARPDVWAWHDAPLRAVPVLDKGAGVDTVLAVVTNRPYIVRRDCCHGVKVIGA